MGSVSLLGLSFSLCDYEEYIVLDCNAVQFRESWTFQWNILPPSSESKSKTSKKPVDTGGKVSFPAATFVFCLSYSLSRKMEVICSTIRGFLQTIGHYNPENRTLHGSVSVIGCKGGNVSAQLAQLE
jgi:hypothetical protein